MAMFTQKSTVLTVRPAEKVAVEDIAMAMKDMKYEDLLKIGEQFSKIAEGERGVLSDMKPHDWVAFVHRWSQLALEKPAMNYYQDQSTQSYRSTDKP